MKKNACGQEKRFVEEETSKGSLKEIQERNQETLCRKGMLKALAYDWKLNRAIEYISRSWSFLLIFCLFCPFCFAQGKKGDKR
ncbi:hypothetical protein [Bartonella vinsonii]|uniref:hypothetical protein n=1 Tax=Bartonella vinsonii TaxID=33047 RepID=UPI00034ABD72|nr:hypothetical protein [Bartonella vinsonii]